MTTAERWAWHAEVYAFRRIVLGEQGETSPCDPDGVWFDAALVAAAETRLLAKRSRRQREDARHEQLRREGVAICNAWAQRNGFSDFAAAELAGKTHLDVLAGINQRAAAEAPRRGAVSLAAALGVRATEWRPTAEQMAAGRRELGFEEAAE